MTQNKTVTLIFPGQGSQYVGMAKHLEHKYEHLFTLANSTLGFDLKSLMFEGPEDKLKLTEFTQPAIVTHSYLLFLEIETLLKKHGIQIKQVLGHSVGEYSALLAAGVLDFPSAIKAVHWRGKFMQEAVPEGLGSMVALLKVPEDVAIAACKASSQENSVVMPANFNDPSQIVISGHKDACERAVLWLKDNFQDAHRAIPLNVSAPFHSSLMKPASERLEQVFQEFPWKTNTLPYIANIDASYYGENTHPKTIQKNLILQAYGPVQWTQSILSTLSKIEGENEIFIEVGPSKVLAGLVKKIDKNSKILALDQDSVQNSMEEELLKLWM